MYTIQRYVAHIFMHRRFIYLDPIAYGYVEVVSTE